MVATLPLIRICTDMSCALNRTKASFYRKSPVIIRDRSNCHTFLEFVNPLFEGCKHCHIRLADTFGALKTIIVKLMDIFC